MIIINLMKSLERKPAKKLRTSEEKQTFRLELSEKKKILGN